MPQTQPILIEIINTATNNLIFFSESTLLTIIRKIAKYLKISQTPLNPWYTLIANKALNMETIKNAKWNQPKA